MSNEIKFCPECGIGLNNQEKQLRFCQNLPACGVGAIHRRERIWFIAYANKKRLSWGINENGFGERTLEKPIKKLFPYKIANSHNDLSKPYNTIRNDGLSKQLDGIAFSNWLIESIKGYGNAIVPQVVYQIFKTIEQYELATDAYERFTASWLTLNPTNRK